MVYKSTFGIINKMFDFKNNTVELETLVKRQSAV
jgi:hypothetical protein